MRSFWSNLGCPFQYKYNPPLTFNSHLNFIPSLSLSVSLSISASFLSQILSLSLSLSLGLSSRKIGRRRKIREAIFSPVGKSLFLLSSFSLFFSISISLYLSWLYCERRRRKIRKEEEEEKKNKRKKKI
jgi:hypothetical protein